MVMGSDPSIRSSVRKYRRIERRWIIAHDGRGSWCVGAQSGRDDSWPLSAKPTVALQSKFRRVISISTALSGARGTLNIREMIRRSSRTLVGLLLVVIIAQCLSAVVPQYSQVCSAYFCLTSPPSTAIATVPATASATDSNCCKPCLKSPDTASATDAPCPCDVQPIPGGQALQVTGTGLHLRVPPPESVVRVGRPPFGQHKDWLSRTPPVSPHLRTLHWMALRC